MHSTRLASRTDRSELQNAWVVTLRGIIKWLVIDQLAYWLRARRGRPNWVDEEITEEKWLVMQKWGDEERCEPWGTSDRVVVRCWAKGRWVNEIWSSDMRFPSRRCIKRRRKKAWGPQAIDCGPKSATDIQPLSVIKLSTVCLRRESVIKAIDVAASAPIFIKSYLSAIELWKVKGNQSKHRTKLYRAHWRVSRLFLNILKLVLSWRKVLVAFLV